MDFINTCFETTNEVRSLAYYSHLVPMFAVLSLGFLVARFAKNRDKAVLFIGFVILLSLWLLGDVIAWTFDDYHMVAGFWSTLDFLNILFYLFILCFVVYDLTKNRKLRLASLITTGLASIVPFVITFAGLAVHEFDEPNCEMIGNDFLALYKLGVEWIVILAITTIGFISYKKIKGNSNQTKKMLLSVVPIICFLAIFSSSEFFATYTGVYEINLYALFTLPIFVLILTFNIIEDNTFKFTFDSSFVVRVLFLMFVIISTASLFLVDDFPELISTVASIIVTLGFGTMLLRTANKETEQRREIEKLANSLEHVNIRLKALDKQKSEFVSIASHQLRSPLTAIRGYASLLLEGSYGRVTKTATEPIKRIEQSSKMMAMAIEDYLNVSRIESGNMKYNMSDFNLKDEVEHLCDDLRTSAVKQGLVLIFRTDLNSRGIIHADIGKTVQVLQNLVHNAIKYTKKGSIKVLVRDDIVKKRIYVDVIDTGIGMDTNTLHAIFQKFERASNANSVNIHGTGLGLFVALRMSEAMGGTITAHSDGNEAGSRFTLDLPLAL